MDFRAKSWGAKSWSLGRCLLPLLLILLCSLTLPALLWADVQINVSYIYVADSPSEVDNANGTTLLGIANAAASLWEDYLVGDETYDFAFSWDKDPSYFDSPTLGYCDPNKARIWILDDPEKEDYLSNQIPWYVDESPLDHSEFNFSGTGSSGNNWVGQTLYKDLNDNDKADWFDAVTIDNIPDLLEVGFNGAAISGGAAANQRDLFSTVIHEMGHALGVNHRPFDYGPLPESQVGGWTTVELVSTPVGDGHSHLEIDPALMAKGQLKPNLRRLPSAVDILAIDFDESGWPDGNITGVDLPRQDFLGNVSEPNDALTTIWNIPSNWEGGTLPDQDDDAFIRPPTGSITLTGDATVKSLLIDNSTSLDVQQNTLMVTGATSLIATSATDIRGSSSLIVPAGGIFSSGGTMRVANLGEIHLLGGQLRATDQIVTITGGTGDGGLISGHGQIELDGTTASIVNDGTIRTDSLATGITIHNALGSITVASSTIDLDGASEGGSVHVDTGDLTITPYVHVADAFDKGGATVFAPGIAIDSGRTFSVGSILGWTLGRNGDLQLGSPSFGNPPAVISDGGYGGTFIVHGDIEVPFGKRGHLETAVRLENDAVINADGVLRLSGYTILATPKTSGFAIEQYGNAYVEDHSSMRVEIYDWDGDDSNPSSVDLAPGKSFQIFPDVEKPQELRIDYADNGYDGSTSVNGGHLYVATASLIDEQTMAYGPTAWTINPNGLIELNNYAIASESSTLDGSQLKGSPVIVEGTLAARGPQNEVLSDHLTLQPGGSVALHSISVADLGNVYVSHPGQLSMPAGGVTYSGGTITGAGSIHHEGSILVNGDVSAEVSVFDFDGQQTTLGNQINIQGGRLQVKAAALQDGINTDLVSSDFEINNGALLVSRVADPLASGPPSAYLSWKLKSNSEIELTGNAVISASDDLNNLAKFGSEMQVAGLVKASGTGNTIYAPTRVLQGGQIVAENDQLEIAGNTTVAAGGVVQANAGGGIRFSKPLFLEGGGTLQADGRVLLEGGTYLQGGTLEGNAAIRSDSDLFVEQPSTSNVKYLDLDGANEAQTLRLQADFTVNAESIEYSWTNVNNPITAELPKFDGNIDVNAPATLTMNIGNASAGDVWILDDGVVWVDANLDDGVGEGKGLNIAGSPFQFCNTSIHIGAGSWLNIDADASGIFQPVQGGGEMKFNANWSPGKSPAALSFAGDLGFGPDARVIMEIYRGLEADGSDPFGQLYGTDPFDSFEVAGLIDLGGATLEVIFQDGFQPVAGQSFPLFAASSILGSFSKIIPQGLPQGLMLDASGLSGGVLSVAVSPEPATLLLVLFGLALLPRRRRR